MADQTDEFDPDSASDDLGKTDFFDFVVSPPPHCAMTGGVSDEENYLHRTTNRGMSYLQDPPPHDDHDARDIHTTTSSAFIKETNNNTLTALPPVSTINPSLSHHGSVRNHCVSTDQVPMDQSDCTYWRSDEKTTIFFEDLNKFTWSPHNHTTNHGDTHIGNELHRVSTTNDRGNTDGAIYTLTVLNNETNSMDALDCCKSPAPPSTDPWSLDAILNLEPSSNDPDQNEIQNTVDVTRVGAERYHVIPTPSSQYTDDSGFVESKELCRQNNGTGDNNNDWKLSDQNHLQEAVAAAAAAGDSDESLLRNALQGKLYSVSTQIASPSSSQSSTISLPVSRNNSGGLQMIDHQQQQVQTPQTQGSQQNNETMHTCTDDDLLLSQLDTTTYRPGDYEKLKRIANEVVESYCNLEPVCNVSATTTTVMYTLDPTSGSLGTITLPADLGQVGTVTVVAAQPDLIQGTPRQEETQPTSSQIPIVAPTRSTNSGTKAPKKYCRRSNKNNANSNGSSSVSPGNGNGGQQQGNNTGGSPSAAQRKERSLHYCSICSKGFKDKYSVNVHIRTHTGEKPFACSLCGKSFRQKAHLAKHYQTHVAQKANVGNGNSNNNNNNNNASPTESTTSRGSISTDSTVCNQSS